MDWNKVNVALDQDAFREAQAAGNSNMHLPLWIIFLIAFIAVGFVAFKVVKSKGDKNKAGSGDKK